MTHVAIVTYFSLGAYDTNSYDENNVLSNILSDLDISHEIVSWSDPEVNWGQFSLLLFKSTWDYFDHYSAFLSWLDKIRILGIPTLNSLNTIIWNSSKSYLLEIESKGFPVIAGMILPKGRPIALNEIANKIQTESLVIKPLVSGGAKRTLKLEKKNWAKHKNEIQSWMNEEAFLVQPFVPEVEKVGEYSLLFFNGKFSHAVLKTPAKEDFRVQHYFGGTIKQVNPSASMLASCLMLVDEYAKESLYVRVDGVEIEGVFHLMELEMIEPYLFLESNEEAIGNYKNAIQERLS